MCSHLVNVAIKAACFGEAQQLAEGQQFLDHLSVFPLPANNSSDGCVEHPDQLLEQCRAKWLSDGVSEERISQLSCYIDSIRFRMDVIGLLNREGLHALFESLSTRLSIAANVRPKFEWGGQTLDSSGACLRMTLLWLVFDLALWALELEHERGPWVKAATWHLKMKDVMDKIMTHCARASSSLPAAGLEGAVHTRLFLTYLADEMKFLEDAVGARLRALLTRLSHEQVTKQQEDKAREVVQDEVKFVVSERHSVAIELFNDFENSLNAGQSDEQFVPRLQWVYLASNASHPTGWVDGPEPYRVLPEHCHEKRAEYAESIEHFFAWRIGKLSGSANEECLSEPDLDRPGDAAFRFADEISWPLADGLGLNCRKLADVLDPLHDELMLHVRRRTQLVRTWGVLAFDGARGLILRRSESNSQL
jgi:hypothetical protein